MNLSSLSKAKGFLSWSRARFIDRNPLWRLWAVRDVPLGVVAISPAPAA
jgi:hypothetical protein